MLDDEAIPDRLMALYPPAQISPTEFEDFVAELLGAGEPGLQNFEAPWMIVGDLGALTAWGFVV